MNTTVDCPGTGMVGSPSPDSHARNDRVGFRFVAPPNTAIVGYKRAVEGATAGSAYSWAWSYHEYKTVPRFGPGRITLATCFNCGPFSWLDFDGQSVNTRDRADSLEASLICVDLWPNPCPGGGAWFALRRVAVTLEDVEPPMIVGAHGSLLETGLPLKGDRALELDMIDAGGGLYRAILEVDGRPLVDRPIDANGGACVTPFSTPVPCKLSARITLPVATSQLRDGRHDVSVRVIDATGTNTVVYGPITVETDNFVEPPERGSCSPGSGRHLVVRVRRRSVAFGAPAWVTGRVSGLSRSTLRGATVVISSDTGLDAPTEPVRMNLLGKFRARIHVRRSETVQPIVRSGAGEVLGCGRRWTIPVRAGIRFSVSPKRLNNHESIRLQGRLLGLPVPTGGKTVAIQARARGRRDWTTVTMLRTTTDGRFSFVYRFRRTFRTTTYEFRALSTREREYPYAKGWSQIRRAVVRP